MNQSKPRAPHGAGFRWAIAKKDMLLDDPILKKRPVNATQRLEPDSRVFVLSLRDVLGALGDDGPVLLGCVCELPQMVAPILRAARDEDAVLVLSPGGSLADPRFRHRFFELVRAAAEQVGTTRPIVISNEPVAVVGDPDGPAERIHSLVDAGCTGLSIRIDEPDLEESPSSVARACEAALERELGVQMLLAPGGEDDAGALTGALKLLDAAPDLVGVLGGSGVGLSALASEVEPVGISWHEGEDEGELREALRNALGAGVRMVTVRSVFAKVLLESLPAEARKRVIDEGGLHQARAKGLVALAAEIEGLDQNGLDRAEARIYGETEELLSLFRLRGSGRWIHDRL